MTDYLDLLFPGHETTTAEEIEAGLQTMRDSEAARHEAMAAATAAREAEKAANRCPKCMGEGRIAQFSHRKGGECFTCGGTGVFTKYRG
jgi:DnaJ-class molecular chaperone